MEYKFRGLGLYSKKWVYGNLIHMEDADEDYRDVIIPIEDNCTYIDNDDGYGAEDWHKVDSKTVSPSTGVKDINKKESYLGDILKEPRPTYGYEKSKDHKKEFYVVKKKDKSNNMYLEYNYNIRGYWQETQLGLDRIEELEIVGNIFQNADMIKKEV